MNLVLVRRDADGGTTLITPPVGDTVLAGITRASLIVVARSHGIRVDERRIAVDEWAQLARAGDVVESFGCGNAAVITPIGRVQTRDDNWTIGDGEMGPVTRRLRDELLDVQEGRR